MARPKAAVDYDGEINLCDEMIAKYRAKKQRLLQAKQDDENRRIVFLVREHKLSLDELNSAVEYIVGRKSSEEASAAEEQPAEEKITDAPSVIKEEKSDEEIV